jgi:N-acyl-D-aspartate/D-glutamate deacylase
MVDTFSYSTRLLEKGVREFNVISLEQAIHKITQRPAEYFGLIDRGVIKEGYFADLVVFDPATVRPGAAYNRYDVPGGDEVIRIYADAIGVDHVFVNGTQIVKNGEHTGALPGSVIRSGKDTRTVPLDAMREKSPELAPAK